MSIKVGCKCGWEGDQKNLLPGPKDQDGKYCPSCGRLFAKYPPASAGEASAIAAHEYLWGPPKFLGE